MAYNPANANGSATSANSAPVVIASDQAAFAPPIPFINVGAIITRPGDTTTYAFGDLVANSVTGANVTPTTIAASRGVDIASIATRFRLVKSNSSTSNAIFRSHVYNVLPTVSGGDNAPWISSQSGYLGSFDVTMNYPFSTGAEGFGNPTVGNFISYAPIAGSSAVYCLLEARAAYLPISGETFTPYLEGF